MATEAAVALAQPGLSPAGVLCELMTPDGEMPGAAVDEYAHTHQLPQLAWRELAHWLALHPAD